ncbi:MAG: hypothetical protein J2P49_10125 [Methylocapsa sp.]|nr:hypothetical protein [Methylocapsa sp.]
MLLEAPPSARALAVTASVRRHLLCSLPFCLGSFLAVLAFLTARPAVNADEGRTLIIPPNDGYGFEECLTPGSQCGLVVADAWCRAHGFAGSREFHLEPDGAADIPPGSVRVVCGGGT